MSLGLRRALVAAVALAVAVGGYFIGRASVSEPAGAPPPPELEAMPYAAPSEAAAAAPDPEGLAEGEDERPRRRERLAERRRQRLDGGARFDGGVRPQRAPRGGATMALEQAIRERASGVWVEGEGAVRRLMRDDLRGRQHQRFLLELAGGGTLLVAHNTQLAERLPVAIGDTVRFRGRFEWNRRGGLVHWTHDDPRGGAGGWLEHDGTRYE